MLALVKLTALFAGVLLLLRCKAPLWAALSAGAAGAALLFGMGPAATARAGIAIATCGETLSFVGLVGLVLTLSLVLRAGAQIERITASLEGFVRRRRFLAAALPAIVGFLPMPGGALFSAPMVDAAVGEGGTGPDDRVAVNHWFRHVWEYSWPLYPGLILAADLMDLTVGDLILLQWPLTVLSLAVGAAFLLRRIPPGIAEAGARAGGKMGSGARFLFEMAPFLLVVVIHIAAGVPLLPALVAGIVWGAGVNLARGTVRPAALLRAVFWNLNFWGFVFMAFGVKLFGGMLSESGALAELGAFFARSGIPPVLLVILLPFVTGMVSGITIVYVSTAFPVLLSVPDVAAAPIPYLVLAFGSGFTGTLLSPIHACLILATAYFKGSLARAVLRLALPSMVVLAAAVGLHVLYRIWMPL